MRCLVSFLAAAVLTFSAGVLAQDFYKPPTKVSVSPVGVNPTGKATGGGINALLTMQGVDDSGRSAAYAARNVRYQPSTLGKIARAARGGPATFLGILAFGALLDAAGWAIDELTGQVMIPGSDGDAPPAGSAVWCTQSWGSSFTGKMCGSSPQDFIGQSTGWPGGTYTVTGYAPQSSTAGTLIVNNGSVGGMTVQVFAYQPTTHQWLGAYPAQPVPEAQVDDLVGNAIADRPDTWPAVLREPDGRPRVTPEVQAALDDYQQELERERGLVESPDTPVAEDWETQPNNMATDWPSFCGWASVVCDFIDWYRAPPADYQDIPMPETELPGPSGWVSSLGQGSCPAPHVINLNLGQQTYEWEPWCDLASRIKPLVIASAAFAALLILAGVSRRGDGNA